MRNRENSTSLLVLEQCAQLAKLIEGVAKDKIYDNWLSLNIALIDISMWKPLDIWKKVNNGYKTVLT